MAVRSDVMAASTPDPHLSAGPVERTGDTGTADRVYGVIGTVMVGMALLLLVAGGPLGAADEVVSTPTLELVAPAPGAHPAGPLELVFRSEVALEQQPGGWGARGLHVHAEINGREVMPGPADLRPGPDGTYVWTLGPAAKGDATVRIRWSDLQHLPIEEGASEIVRITVQ